MKKMTLLLASMSAVQALAGPSIVPMPASLVELPGEFVLNSETKIASDKGSLHAAEFLRDSLRPPTGLRLPIVSRGGRNAVSLRIDPRLSKLGDEGYRLEVKPDRIDISSYRPQGALYAVQTLRQLLPPAAYRRAKVAGMKWAVPGVRIEDRPRFGWRGALVDSCRHFIPKEGILRFLDTLSAHKLNVFHWHLTDDNGWRLEIRKYPRLTSIGAWQPETLLEYDPPKPKSGFRGGYYTQDDVREVVAYAESLGITVMPEIEMPGHSGAIVASYPELGVPGS
ncbi:MAG TPA: family 20 glycosylhydrolase, partial [Fimbriimonas sp.]